MPLSLFLVRNLKITLTRRDGNEPYSRSFCWQQDADPSCFLQEYHFTTFHNDSLTWRSVCCEDISEWREKVPLVSELGTFCVPLIWYMPPRSHAWACLGPLNPHSDFIHFPSKPELLGLPAYEGWPASLGLWSLSPLVAFSLLFIIIFLKFQLYHYQLSISYCILVFLVCFQFYMTKGISFL